MWVIKGKGKEVGTTNVKIIFKKSNPKTRNFNTYYLLTLPSTYCIVALTSPLKKLSCGTKHKSNLLMPSFPTK